MYRHPMPLGRLFACAVLRPKGSTLRAVSQGLRDGVTHSSPQTRRNERSNSGLRPDASGPVKKGAINVSRATSDARTGRPIFCPSEVTPARSVRIMAQNRGTKNAWAVAENLLVLVRSAVGHTGS